MKQEKFKKLVNKLKQGKKEYFSEFYDLTKTAVFFEIRKLIKDEMMIEDVMQDTFISFINALKSLDSEKNAFAYLLMIAKNRAINELKKNEKVEVCDYIEDLAEEHNTFDEFPLLKFCKSNLTEEEFNILELTIIQGYRRVEVAKMLNQPISTINWKYNKILKILKTNKKFLEEVANEK